MIIASFIKHEFADSTIYSYRFSIAQYIDVHYTWQQSEAKKKPTKQKAANLLLTSQTVCVCT